MKAVFFGSLSVLADTSELQRTAFNLAFQEAGLPWDWSQDHYRKQLMSSGGQDRIADYAAQQGMEVDAEALHARKSAIFQNALGSAQLDMRQVPREIMAFAKNAGLKLAFLSTSSRENVEALVCALNDASMDDFALVTSIEDVSASKPAPDIYTYALAEMGLEAQDVIALEDNAPGVQAAQAAGITCLAYPNQNTAGHDFGTAPAADTWQKVAV